MKQQNILSGFFVLLLTACSSLAPTPTATATVTATIAPTATPSFTPMPTATPTPEFSPEQQAWMDYFSENGYVIEENGIVKSKNGSIVEGLKLEGDNIVFTFAYPELGGDIFPIILEKKDLIFAEDGSLDIPAFRFDGKTMSQEHVVTDEGKEIETLKIPVQVIIEMIERESAWVLKELGESKFEEVRNRKIGWTWGSWIFGFNGRTPGAHYKGIKFKTIGAWIYWDSISVIDKSGKEIKDVPTIIYAYEEMIAGNQSIVGYIKTDGNVVVVFVDSKLGKEDLRLMRYEKIP